MVQEDKIFCRLSVLPIGVHYILFIFASNRTDLGHGCMKRQQSLWYAQFVEGIAFHMYTRNLNFLVQKVVPSNMHAFARK